LPVLIENGLGASAIAAPRQLAPWRPRLEVGRDPLKTAILWVAVKIRGCANVATTYRLAIHNQISVCFRVWGRSAGRQPRLIGGVENAASAVAPPTSARYGPMWILTLTDALETGTACRNDVAVGARGLFRAGHDVEYSHFTWVQNEERAT
jgi:hypothetical protein